LTPNTVDITSNNNHIFQDDESGHANRVRRAIEICPGPDRPVPSLRRELGQAPSAGQGGQCGPALRPVRQGLAQDRFSDPVPVAVGHDVSGVVIKAGGGTGFKEGDEVYGFLNMTGRGLVPLVRTVTERVLLSTSRITFYVIPIRTPAIVCER